MQLLEPYRDKTLSFGCRFKDSLNNHGTYTMRTDFVIDELPYDIHFLMDDDGHSVEVGASEWFFEEMTILGHPPTLATVLMALNEKLDTSTYTYYVTTEGRLVEEGDCEIGTLEVIDLTQSPSEYSEEVSAKLVELIK